MKTYRMLALLAGLAVVQAVQTGCVITDFPPIETRSSQDVLDCITFDRIGRAGNVIEPVAKDMLWYRRVAGPGSPFNGVTTKISATDARDWFHHLGAGAQVDGDEIYTVGVGTEVFGVQNLTDSTTLIKGYTARSNTVKFSCYASRSNSASILPSGPGRGPWLINTGPEGGLVGYTRPLAGNLNGNLAGHLPSNVYIDRFPAGGGCQFFNNLVAKNPGTWATPGLCGLVPCSTIVTPGASGKYATALGLCYSTFPSFSTGFLTALPVLLNGETDETGCGSVEFGVPQQIALKSGEASALCLPELNEETGEVKVSLLEATVRGKVFRPVHAPYITISSAGRGVIFDQDQPGVTEAAKWALENVDLNEPFALNGEYLPIVNHPVGAAAVLVDKGGVELLANR